MFSKIYILANLLLTLNLLTFGQVKERNNISTSNQEIEDDESNIPAAGPENCRALRVYLERYIVNGKKLDEGTKIIIILRLNKRETAKYYNIRRKAIADWFEQYFPKRVVLAKGDSMKALDDLGRADIYINGKKSFIINFKIKDTEICVGARAG